MRILLFYFTLLNMLIANSHPMQTDDLTTIGVGSKLFIIEKDLNLPATKESITIFKSKIQPNYTYLDNYIQDSCSLYFPDSPTSFNDRAIKVGSYLTISSIRATNENNEFLYKIYGYTSSSKTKFLIICKSAKLKRYPGQDYYTDYGGLYKMNIGEFIIGIEGRLKLELGTPIYL